MHSRGCAVREMVFFKKKKKRDCKKQKFIKGKRKEKRRRKILEGAIGYVGLTGPDATAKAGRVL